ncbi:uncharacterized protein LY89DRAFT_695594 [Mollisia scopiformis]|uniref:Uncharacterized protein n=1 Tax=Mollisia scopiformis TaxID=149040 RepID=A0A194XIF5_MOLSC|nr:uncharacterized protein LY89DRAFT_695594 [Mollisia scopiformis]KUJ20010.1 hypothetical protein LY89DRAFT_695594 [Mollisia scopiformis]
MGVVQKPSGNMKGGVSGQLKTPFVITIVVLFIVWSLLSLDMPSLRSTVDTNTSLESSPQPTNGAGLETSISNPTESPTEGSAADVIIAPTEPAAEESKPVSERPLILYAYADSEEGTSLVNLKFFIEHGLHDAADFIFILNGETTAGSLIPQEDNIRVVQRPNDCYDLGAYAEVLTTNDLYKGYKRFIMMNASLRGPFMPYWSNACWSDMYLSKITDEVKLVGMTANCWPTFHIQSMIWATDLTGLETLLFPPQSALDYISTHPILLPPPKNKEAAAKTPSPETSRVHQAPGINACFHTWDSAVAAEISSTSLIRAEGYKVDAMMAAYHGMRSYEEGVSCAENRDVLFDGEYFGTNVHPFETGFLKSNRDVDPLGLERQSQWMRGRGYRSYDYCRAP